MKKSMKRLYQEMGQIIQTKEGILERIRNKIGILNETEKKVGKISGDTPVEINKRIIQNREYFNQQIRLALPDINRLIMVEKDVDNSVSRGQKFVNRMVNIRNKALVR
jgi:hypothetical protein